MPKPVLPAPDNVNKGEQTRRDTDAVKNYAVTLLDIDSAIMAHFTNKIAPHIDENSERVNVPIIYGSPEKWKAVQKDGMHRDVHGKLQIPLIMFKRNSIAKNENMAMLNRYVSHVFRKSYSSKNRYDKYSLMNGVTPAREMYNVTMPDYVNLSYECIIWTEYQEDMNKIIEQIQFDTEEYWGEDDSFRFRVYIDDFSNVIDISDTDQRVVKTEFTMLVAAYLLPEEFANKMTSQKVFSAERLVILNEIDATTKTQHPSTYGVTSRTAKSLYSPIYVPPSGRQGQIEYEPLFNFLSLNKSITADFVSVNDGGYSTFHLTGYELADIPSQFTSIITSNDLWDIFVNGVGINKTYITFVDAPANNGSDSLIKFDIGTLGYTLNSGDEVFAVGKFEGV